MSCRNFQDKMEDYIKGSFSQHEGLYFDEHLSGCDKCRQQVADLRATFSLLQDMEVREVPPGLEARIVKAVEPVVHRQRNQSFRIRKLTAIMASAVALTLVVLAAVNYPWGAQPGPSTTVFHKQPASVGRLHPDYLSTSNRFEVDFYRTERVNGLRLLRLNIME